MIIKYVKKYLFQFVLMIFFTFVVVLFNLFMPMIMSGVIDNLTNQVVGPYSTFIKDNLLFVAIFIIIVGLIGALFTFFRGTNNAIFAENICKDLRVDLYNHIQNCYFDYHVKTSSGELIQRCTNDIETIRKVLGSQLSEGIYSVLIAIIVLVIMGNINIKLTIISTISLPILFGYAYIFFKNIQKRFLASDIVDGKLVSELQEIIGGVRVVKAFNNEAFEINKFDKVNQEYRDITYKLVELLGVYWASSDLIVYSQILLLIVVGILEVINGTLTIGSLMLFISYEFMILYPIRNLGRILSDIGRMTVSEKRLDEILKVETENLEAGIEADLDGDIVFENVCSAYDNIPVLHDLNLTIANGSTLAIMGTTGAGKSTLVNLLVGLYKPNSGHIYINGTDINDIKKSYLRKNIGIVLQEPFLYSKTIYDNVANHGISELDVYMACKIANIDDAIRGFSEGYQTIVGEKGVTLSGGQKQRLAIARTLATSLKVVIFDDSLSAVDTQTDALIRNNLSKLDKDMTKIIICQRTNSAKNADKIIIMDEGKIVEMGNHEQLLKKEGIYAKIYRLQNNLEDKEV